MSAPVIYRGVINNPHQRVAYDSVADTFNFALCAHCDKPKPDGNWALCNSCAGKYECVECGKACAVKVDSDARYFADNDDDALPAHCRRCAREHKAWLALVGGGNAARK